LGFVSDLLFLTIALISLDRLLLLLPSLILTTHAGVPFSSPVEGTVNTRSLPEAGKLVGGVKLLVNSM
jgi:hypothetical protein